MVSRITAGGPRKMSCRHKMWRRLGPVSGQLPRLPKRQTFIVKRIGS